MSKLKDKLYNHEEMPPVGTWERIATELDRESGVVYMPARKKSLISKIAVAASILVILLAGVFYLTNRNEGTKGAHDTPPQQRLSSTAQPSTDSRYIIVTTPSGQKVKISSKFSNYVGSLYQDSAANSDWYKKFEEWRGKMQNQTVTPTTSNFMDIIEMSDFLENAN
jgi:hypothetical protein